MTNLKYGDVQGIAHDGKLTAAKVIADNEFCERYITFVTPEAYRIFEKYIDQRKSYGEIITDSSPVIIKRFDVNGKGANIDNSRIAPSTLDGLMISAAIKAGVREPSQHYKNRYKNKACHAFRKTFESVLLNATNEEEDLVVNPVIAVRLLGDKVKTELGLGVIEHYRRNDPLQRNASDPNNEYTSLLHEYKKVVRDLTIGDEERVKVENEQLKLDIKNLNTVNIEIENIKKQMAIILQMAKKGTKFPPNSRVAVLNDLEGNDESPLVIHTDQNGEIENMAIDELRENAKFESMTEVDQTKEIEKNRNRAIKTIYHLS